MIQPFWDWFHEQVEKGFAFFPGKLAPGATGSSPTPLASYQTL